MKFRVANASRGVTVSMDASASDIFRQRCDAHGGGFQPIFWNRDDRLGLDLRFAHGADFQYNERVHTMPLTPWSGPKHTYFWLPPTLLDRRWGRPAPSFGLTQFTVSDPGQGDISLQAHRADLLPGRKYKDRKGTAQVARDRATQELDDLRRLALKSDVDDPIAQAKRSVEALNKLREKYPQQVVLSVDPVTGKVKLLMEIG